MEKIDPVKAKEIVRLALTEVADFTGNFEAYSFQQFKLFHIKVFLNSIKNNVIKTPCSDENGNLVYDECFDIDLSQVLFKKWSIVKDCIDYITSSHFRTSGTIKRIKLS